jgi:site-specific recombinase XerD
MRLSLIANYCAADPSGRPRVSGQTKAGYKTVQKHLLEFLGDIEVEEVTKADLEDWQSWLESRAESNVVSDNTYKRTARALWRYMKKRELAVCDTGGVFQFRKELKGVKSISIRNAQRMLAFTGIRETAIILMANESACRRGGLASMRKSLTKIWYDERLGEYCLAAQVVEKGDKPRWVFGYHDSALAMMLWLKIRNGFMQSMGFPENDYVFINLRNGEPLRVSAISSNNARIKQKANIPADEHCNLHAHRHFRAKELLKQLSLDEVSDLLGHEDINTTAIYTERSDLELAEVFFRSRKK